MNVLLFLTKEGESPQLHVIPYTALNTDEWVLSSGLTLHETDLDQIADEIEQGDYLVSLPYVPDTTIMAIIHCYK